MSPSPKWQNFKRLFSRFGNQSAEGASSIGQALPWLILRALAGDLRSGEIALRATSLVFTTLLSIVPLLAISFSVLKGFGAHNQLEPFLLGLLEPLGPQGAEIAVEIVAFVENVKVGVLGSVGVAMLFYTVLSMVQKIESALNFTWRVGETRPLARRFSDYLSVIVVGPVFIFGSIGLTTAFLGSARVEALLELPLLGVLLQVAAKLAPYLLIVAVFAFFYVLIPNTKVRIRSALVGAAAAGFMWEIMKWAFSAFVLSSGNYSSVYAAFATPIIFMIWLFFDWMVILLGSRIAFYHQNAAVIRPGQEKAALDIRRSEALGLDIMRRVGRRFYGDGDPLGEAELTARHPHLDAAVRPLLERLIAAGFLIRSDDESPSLLPARPLEDLRVADVLDVLRGGDDEAEAGFVDPIVDPSAKRIIDRTEASARRGLRGLTIKALAEGEGNL